METISRHCYANSNLFIIPGDKKQQQFNPYFRYHVEKPIVRSPCPSTLRKWHQFPPLPINYKTLNQMTFREAINELHRQRIWTTAAQKALSEVATVTSHTPVPNDRGIISAAAIHSPLPSTQHQLPLITITQRHTVHAHKEGGGEGVINNGRVSQPQTAVRSVAMATSRDSIGGGLVSIVTTKNGKEQENEEEGKEDEKESKENEIEEEKIPDQESSNNVTICCCHGNVNTVHPKSLQKEDDQLAHTSQQYSTLPLINTSITKSSPHIITPITYTRPVPGFGGYIPRFPQPERKPVSDEDYRCTTICSTARESYRKFPPLEYRHFRIHSHRKAPLAKAVTLTYPYNPFNKIQESLR